VARDRRPVRRAVTVGAGLVVLLAALDVATLRSTASANVNFDVTNATINAGADYVVYFNGAFPNWTPGLAASYIPLAHSHIDNAPFAEGTASPGDTGPAGQTAVATVLSKTQPQYAEQKYPPGAAKPATFGSPGGPYAEASAGATKASSLASAGGNTASGQSSAASAQSVRIAAFNAAFSAWRARFLTPQAAAAHPQVVASAANPDGTDGDTASSSVTLDAAQGLIASGDSRVQNASFGGGAVDFHDVHTAVTIINSGTPKATITVNVGDVTVGGAPASVGKDGLTVGPNTVPLDQLQQANQQLNQILAAAGLTITEVAPDIKTSTAQETVTATGVRVSETQPGPPQQTVQHTLGYVFADNLAVPSAAAVDLGGLGAGSLGGSGLATGSGYVPGTEGSPATLGSPGSPGTTAPGTTTAPPAGKSSLPAAPASSLIKNKPLWLLLLYFMWQSLLVGTLCSIWWWRHGGAMAKAAAT